MPRGSGGRKVRWLSTDLGKEEAWRGKGLWTQGLDGAGLGACLAERAFRDG